MTLLYLLIAIALLPCLFIALRPRVELTLGGRMFAFVAIILLPVAAGFAGFNTHMERCKTVAFCLSCHVMDKYGSSLHFDDVSHIPASHYQYNRVPRETACFTCHTDYTLFGDYNAKLRGLHHVWVQYLRQSTQARGHQALYPVQQPRVPALSRRRALVSRGHPAQDRRRWARRHSRQSTLVSHQGLSRRGSRSGASPLVANVE